MTAASERLYDEFRAQLERDAAARANGASPTAGPIPIDPAAFYGLPGRFVATISPHSEADPVALLVQYLAAFGNVVGRGPHYRIEGDEHHPCEYMSIVGETAVARKGTSWGRVKQVYRQVDPEWVRLKTAGGLSTGEGLLWELRDKVVDLVEEKDDKKKKTGHWVEEVTDPGVDDKRLLAQEAELSRHFAVMAREGNTFSETVRTLWDDGCAAARARTSRARCTNAHFSVVGHITVDELRRNLTRTEAANGFANRFMWFYVRRARSLPFGGQLDDQELHDLAADTAEAVTGARELGALRFDKDARPLWEERYDGLVEVPPGLLGGILARGAPHVIRLALIFALTDCSPVISLEHLQAGLAVWDFAARSAEYIFGDAVGDPVADDVLRELRDRPDGMTRSEIRDLLGGHHPADRIQTALDVLRKHRLARMDKETGGAGRPAERWRATTTAEGAGRI